MNYETLFTPEEVERLLRNNSPLHTGDFRGLGPLTR